MYLVIGLAAGVGIAGRNLIGSDQKGEIIFGNSVSNVYLALIAILFMSFFSTAASAAASLLSPDNGDSATILFKRELYLVMILMSGFLALAAYLCLPVEFFLKDQPN